ncbi:MAG: hypothetical protein IH616_23280 [Gemmatimonadales bacterium]|nr:hypothetical protein [Gemmatimonadales bacterium]
MGTKMIEVAKLSALIDVAAKAIEADGHEDALNATQADLDEAYREWKVARGLGRVERDTIEWEHMMLGTAEAYADLEKAKRASRNAKKRLRTAIARYKGWIE